MALYSYKNQEPAPLPERVRLENNTTRTSLGELSSEELQSLGFVGPISKPECNPSYQKIVWDGSSYQVVSLTSEDASEAELLERTEKFNSIDYTTFWDSFTGGGVYAKTSDDAFRAELTSLFSDAKSGNANVAEIQKFLNALFFRFEVSEAETAELQGFMNDSNLSVQYTLPDAYYLSSRKYDAETNTISDPDLSDPRYLADQPTLSPYPSWVSVDGLWQAPVAHADDGNKYTWNEESQGWELQS